MFSSESKLKPHFLFKLEQENINHVQFLVINYMSVHSLRLHAPRHMLISENFPSPPTFNDVYVGPLYDIKFLIKCEDY